MEVISPATTQPNPFPATVPFAWEYKPGVPNPFYKFLEQDFAFDVSGDYSVPAEDLFDGGVIKFSSFGELPTSSRSRRTQSFCTDRGWKVPWEEQEEKEKQQSSTTNDVKPRLVSSFSSVSAKGSKRWSLKNLFLFRSSSDGRAMDRDPLKKYSAFLRKHDHEDFKKLSLRSELGKHGSGLELKRRGPVSAHELHYTVNRAVANDMKKRTFLPYKQGILGRSAFNPSVHALSNGFGVNHHNKE